MRFIDTDHPAFRPLWVRLLVTGFLLAWGVLEITVLGGHLWAPLAFGLFAYCVWAFFIAFPRRGDGDPGG